MDLYILHYRVYLIDPIGLPSNYSFDIHIHSLRSVYVSLIHQPLDEEVKNILYFGNIHCASIYTIYKIFHVLLCRIEDELFYFYTPFDSIGYTSL